MTQDSLSRQSPGDVRIMTMKEDCGLGITGMWRLMLCG